MFQVRIHGRGGQGVVTAAEILSIAAFREGWHAQAFPSFGSERTGAPVVAFCRIDDKEIRSREPVLAPDALVIQDPFEALGARDFARSRDAKRACTVPATELALRHFGRPLPNAALLGGFAALSGRLSIDAVAAAIAEKFPEKIATGNIAAARAAYEHVRNAIAESMHAQAD
jgi:pyruvate ferredoxin oxidoreductase gamma subunit